MNGLTALSTKPTATETPLPEAVLGVVATPSPDDAAVAADDETATDEQIVAQDRELTRVAAASAHTTGVGAGLAVLCTGMAMWAALALGVGAVHTGRLDGVFLAVIALIPLAAFELISPLPVAAQALESAQRSAARLSAVLDQPVSVVEPFVAKPAGPGSHHDLRVRGLRVRHTPESPWAVDGVDLDLSDGRRVALVGASGAGKSTIAAVLVRFLEYESGSVRLDGTELRDLDSDRVREIVGLVEQDAHIFDSTLRENVRLAKPSASDAEIMGALARARLSDWVASLPQGLDTAVGEHGASLSGGQRQRLALARALLADFPILVLDEPGEHLDAATADALTRDLLSATSGRTTLLITHRLAALESVDEIVVLDHGRVVERAVPSTTVPPMRGVA
jgi:thiol reductant ABC exporter CydC subunit